MGLILVLVLTGTGWYWCWYRHRLLTRGTAALATRPARLCSRASHGRMQPDDTRMHLSCKPPSGMHAPSMHLPPKPGGHPRHEPPTLRGGGSLGEASATPMQHSGRPPPP